MIFCFSKPSIKASVSAAFLFYVTTVKEDFGTKPGKKDVVLPLPSQSKRIALRFYGQKRFLTDRKILVGPFNEVGLHSRGVIMEKELPNTC